MHVTTLRKVGGSIMLAVPPAILEILDFKAGTPVGIAIEDGRLVVAGRPRPRYALADLLARCEPEADAPEDDRVWASSGAVGGELL